MQRLIDEDFKRSTGVERSTFNTMLEVAGQGLLKKIENTLVKSGQFHLLGKRAFQSGSMEVEIIRRHRTAD
ncbi:MAG: hypothetical protein ACTFAL_13440 [Candidatus Electronema sp. V4]|uniref:hypothetical protein n=1 Tax=Candidatus Electronema sp. V4 TaxID=3454756 RepID=UPI0040554EE2